MWVSVTHSKRNVCLLVSKINLENLQIFIVNRTMPSSVIDRSLSIFIVRGSFVRA